MLLGLLAQEQVPFERFAREPMLTVASVLLIVVSIAWVIVSRLIVRELKKAASRARAAKRGTYRPPRDIWSYPP